MSQDINVLALVKGCERYIFLYPDSQRAETLRILGRFASNPELTFTWYDAAVLSQKIRQVKSTYPEDDDLDFEEQTIFKPIGIIIDPENRIMGYW